MMRWIVALRWEAQRYYATTQATYWLSVQGGWAHSQLIGYSFFDIKMP